MSTADATFWARFCAHGPFVHRLGYSGYTGLVGRWIGKEVSWEKDYAFCIKMAKAGFSFPNELLQEFAKWRLKQ